MTMTTKMTARTFAQYQPTDRSDLLKQVREYALEKGTVKAWDAVLDWSDEELSSKIGKSTKSVLGAVQYITWSGVLKAIEAERAADFAEVLAEEAAMADAIAAETEEPAEAISEDIAEEQDAA